MFYLFLSNCFVSYRKPPHCFSIWLSCISSKLYKTVSVSFTWPNASGNLSVSFFTLDYLPPAPAVLLLGWCTAMAPGLPVTITLGIPLASLPCWMPRFLFLGLLCHVGGAHPPGASWKRNWREICGDLACCKMQFLPSNLIDNLDMKRIID